MPGARDAVSVDVPEDLPLVSADPGLLERVLANLLENAIRHGGGGPVEVVARTGELDAHVKVVDHGPGVPADQRERTVPAIRRERATAPNRVRARPHRRARVRGGDGRRPDRRRLGRRRPDDAAPAAPRAVTHVLVVDDERAIRQALSINLRARDYEVTAVGDGASALAAAASHPPDVVILDLGLPDMDGNDVIEGLRGWSSAPIIVLSARTGQGDKVVSLDGGADDYITKPFGMDELLARLRAALRRSGTDPEAPVGRDRELHRSIWRPSRPRRRRAPCGSRRPSGTCWRCS